MSLIELISTPFATASSNLVLFVDGNIDQVPDLLFEGARLGGIGAAMYTAYRVTNRAQTDAVAIYKTAAADADARLNLERQQWQAERIELLQQLAELRRQARSSPQPE